MSKEDAEVLEKKLADAKEKEKKAKKEKRKKKEKTFMSDFKKFITRGNVLDLAVAMVIGTAFNKIVSGLVNYIIMPSVGIVTGGFSMADRKWIIRHESEQYTELAIQYGAFIQTVIDFLIIAFSVFVAVKIITGIKNKFNEKELEKEKAEAEKKKAEDAKKAEAEKLAAEAEKAEKERMLENICIQSEMLKKIADLMEKSERS